MKSSKNAEPASRKPCDRATNQPAQPAQPVPPSAVHPCGSRSFDNDEVFTDPGTIVVIGF